MRSLNEIWGVEPIQPIQISTPTTIEKSRKPLSEIWGVGLIDSDTTKTQQTIQELPKGQPVDKDVIEVEAPTGTTELPEQIPLPKISDDPEVAKRERDFYGAPDIRSKAFALRNFPMDKGSELIQTLPENEQVSIRNELEKIAKEEKGGANAFAIGLLNSTPIPAFSKDIRKAVKETQEAAPLTTAAGQITGTIAQAIVGGQAIGGVLGKIGPIAKSPLLKTALTRVITSGAIAAEQNIGRKDLGDAVKDVAQQGGGGLISVIPEVLAPPGVAQAIAQPLTDLVYDVAAGKIRGEGVGSKEWWINEIVSLASSAGFGIKDAVSGKSFADNQALQRQEISKLFSKNKDAKVEITDTKAPIEQIETDAAKTIGVTDAERIGTEIGKTGEGQGIEGEGEGPVRLRDVAEDGVETGADGDVRPESIELPIRQRGILSETGSIGGKKQKKLTDVSNDPEIVNLQRQLDQQREDVRKTFVKPVKERIRNAVDFLGEKFVDRVYYAKRMLGNTPEAKQVVGKINASKGSSAEAKMQYDEAEKEISASLPNELEHTLEDYIQAKRTLEIEEYKGEGAIKHTYGMDASKQQKILDTIEKNYSKEEVAAIKKSADRYWQEMKSQLQQLKDNGMLTDEQFAALNEKGMFYSPRKFIQHIDPENTMVQGGKKISVRDSGIQSLDEGSEQAMVKNWRYLLSDVIARTQSRIYKNKASSELGRFVETNPGNDFNAKIDEPLSREVDIEAANSIANNLQGAILKIEQRLKTPLNQEDYLRLGDKIIIAEEKIDQLIEDRGMYETDVDAEVADIQKKVIDLNNDKRLSNTENEYNYYDNMINNLNIKINKLSSYPKTPEINKRIQKLRDEIFKYEQKINVPLSSENIQMLENKLLSLNKKLDKWSDLIKEANNTGGNVILKSKKLKDLPAGKERIFYMENGEIKAILVPKKFADSWNQKDQTLNYTAAKAANVLSGSFILRPLATGALAPEFALSNVPRDLALQWLTTKEYSKAAPVAIFQAANNMRKVFRDAWTGKGRYRDYVKQGGGMEFLNEQGSMFLKDPSKPITPTVERNKQVFGAMTKLQEFSERLTRLALREQAIKNGKSMEEATQIAREYLDFAQGGSWTKALNNAVPYLNASAQGTRSLVRSLKNDPAETSLKAIQLIAMGGAVALTADKFRKDEWSKISDREKVTRWNFPLGMKYTNEAGEEIDTYLSIPKDQSSRIFATFGEVATERALGKIDGEQAWNRIKMAFDDLNPVDLLGLIPPTLSAVAGYTLNKDFWMRDDIWKGRDVSEKHLEYYEGRTPNAYIDLTKKLSDVGIEISPERLHASLREVMPANPTTALMGGAYDQITGRLNGGDKRRINKSILERLSKTIGTRKFLRTTYPDRTDYDKLGKKVDKYGVDINDESGNRKNIDTIKKEVSRIEKDVANNRQRFDHRANVVSKLLLSGDKKAAIGEWEKLKQDAYKQLGNDEIKRIEKRIIKKISQQRGNNNQ